MYECLAYTIYHTQMRLIQLNYFDFITNTYTGMLNFSPSSIWFRVCRLCNRHTHIHTPFLLECIHCVFSMPPNRHYCRKHIHKQQTHRAALCFHFNSFVADFCFCFFSLYRRVLFVGVWCVLSELGLVTSAQIQKQKYICIYFKLRKI